MQTEDERKELRLVARLLAVSITDGKPRSEQVRLLSRAGLQPKEIAELIGTTAHTVSVILSDQRKQDRKSKGSGKRNGG